MMTFFSLNKAFIITIGYTLIVRERYVLLYLSLLYFVCCAITK